MFNPIKVVFGGGNYSALLPPNSFVDAREFASPRGYSHINVFVFCVMHFNNIAKGTTDPRVEFIFTK